MEALLYVLALIAIAIIVYWSITNDNVPLYGKTKGLLAMDDGEYEALAQQPRRLRRGWRGPADGGTGDGRAGGGTPPPGSARPPAGRAPHAKPHSGDSLRVATEPAPRDAPLWK